MMLEKTRHAMATTAHRDRTLKRTVVLSWNPYAKRAGLGDGVVLAARNETGHELHIDAISGTLAIPPGDWAITGNDKRVHCCSDMTFRLTYQEMP